MRARRACLLALAVICALALPDVLRAVGAAADSRFTLAVLRRDGVLIPFASYTGKRFVSDWPGPSVQPDVPISLKDIPKGWWPDDKPLTAWTAWPLDGPTQPIEVQGPVSIPAHCVLTTGLKTTYKASAPVPPREMQPYPKDGVAASGTVTVEHVEVLTDKAPEWKAVIDTLTEPALKEEERGIRSFGSAWEHPSDRKQRAATPVRLDVLCRSTSAEPGRIVYYFEGTKRYANAKNKACDIITFVKGWVVKPAKGPLAPGRVNAAITDCAMEGMVYALPLGLLRLDGKVLWVVQVSGWGYEHYAIVDVAKNEPSAVFTKAGGWCR